MGKYSAVESLLIEEVQKYPALWKTTDPEYKNRSAKDNAWEAITETVNASANTTYSVVDYRDKIWKNLRDSYVRVLSGRNYKSLVYESGDMSKHPQLEPLSFLKTYIYPKKTAWKKRVANINTKLESDEDTPTDNTEIPSTDLPSMADRRNHDPDHEMSVNGTLKDPTSDSTELSSTDLPSMANRPRRYPNPEVDVDDTAIKDPAGDNTEMLSTDLPSMADRRHPNPEMDANGTPRAAKRPYEQTSPNGHEKSIDCKILEYLSRSPATACPCTQSREERCEMDGDSLFGQSVAAQLRLMDKKSNATAKVKIQQILLDVQFPENGENGDS